MEIIAGGINHKNFQEVQNQQWNSHAEESSRAQLPTHRCKKISCIDVHFKMNLAFLFICLHIVRINAVFNYQISARVTDKVSDFTTEISKALSIPLQVIENKLVNLSAPYITCQRLFYFQKLTYENEMANLYLGMETGLFLEYSTQSAATNRGIAFVINSVDATGAPFRIYYNTDNVGLPTNKLRNSSYDVRKRPWYIQAKELKQRFWTSAYIDAASGNPVITLVYPIVNYSLSGNIHRTQAQSALMST